MKPESSKAAPNSEVSESLKRLHKTICEHIYPYVRVEVKHNAR
jgi:hypothetical protein